MKWKRDTPPEPARRTSSQDAEVARLTARADLIIEELDGVVKEMSAMLRAAYEDET